MSHHATITPSEEAPSQNEEADRQTEEDIEGTSTSTEERIQANPSLWKPLGSDNMTKEPKREVSKRLVIFMVIVVILFLGVIIWHGLTFHAYDDHQPMDKQTWPHLTASTSTIFLDTPVSIQASQLKIGTMYSIYLNYNPLYAFTAEEERWGFTRCFQLEECIQEGKELYVELYLVEWDPVKIWDHLRINIEEVNG